MVMGMSHDMRRECYGILLYVNMSSSPGQFFSRGPANESRQSGDGGKPMFAAQIALSC